MTVFWLRRVTLERDWRTWIGEDEFEPNVKDDVLGSPFLYAFQFTRVQKVDVYRKLAIELLHWCPYLGSKVTKSFQQFS